MSKTVTPLNAQLVKFHTSLPFDQVVSRLDKETNKAGNADIAQRMKAAKTQSELEALVRKSLGESGFLYFSETSYHHLDKDGVRLRVMAYVIGNPLIAKSILPANPFMALHIPPRLTIAEIPDGKGTIVAYYLPSSIKTKPDGGNDTASLKFLDGLLEKLVSRVTAKDTAYSRL